MRYALAMLFGLAFLQMERWALSQDDWTVFVSFGDFSNDMSFRPGAVQTVGLDQGVRPRRTRRLRWLPHASQVIRHSMVETSHAVDPAATHATQLDRDHRTVLH